MNRPRASWPLLAVAAFALVAAAACGSDNGTKGGDNSTPAAIAISSGNNQIGAAGVPLATPLAARVTNKQGNPVAGKAVDFTVTRGAGTVASATVTTDNSGVAQTSWTLGTGAVRQEATVSVGSLKQAATATIDTTRALFLLAAKDTVAVGDTIWIDIIAATSGLGAERRGAIQELVTNSIPVAAGYVKGYYYYDTDYLDVASPSGATFSLISSAPANPDARQRYLRLGYIARAPGSGKDVQFSHTATAFFGASTFNDLLTRVSVVGTPVHIR